MPRSLSDLRKSWPGRLVAIVGKGEGKPFIRSSASSASAARAVKPLAAIANAKASIFLAMAALLFMPAPIARSKAIGRQRDLVSLKPDHDFRAKCRSGCQPRYSQASGDKIGHELDVQCDQRRRGERGERGHP